MVNQDIKEYHQLLRDIENKELTKEQKQDIQGEIEKLQIKIKDVKTKEEPTKTEIKNGGKKMIKVKANILKNFIQKTTGNELIQDCKLNFTEKGLVMTHKDSPGIIFISGTLYKTNFVEYEEMSIDIKSTITLIKTLKSFKDNVINIIKEGNMAKFFDASGSLDLATAEMIECFKDVKLDFKYDNISTIPKIVIDTVIERNSIVATEEMMINIENKQVSFVLGQESDVAQTHCDTRFEGKKSVLLNFDYFSKLAGVFDTVFNMSIHDDEKTPMKFSEKTNEYEIDYYLTPKNSSEEQQVKLETKEEEPIMSVPELKEPDKHE